MQTNKARLIMDNIQYMPRINMTDKDNALYARILGGKEGSIEQLLDDKLNFIIYNLQRENTRYGHIINKVCDENTRLKAEFKAEFKDACEEPSDMPPWDIKKS